MPGPRAQPTQVQIDTAAAAEAATRTARLAANETVAQVEAPAAGAVVQVAEDGTLAGAPVETAMEVAEDRTVASVDAADAAGAEDRTAPTDAAGAGDTTAPTDAAGAGDTTAPTDAAGAGDTTAPTDAAGAGDTTAGVGDRTAEAARMVPETVASDDSEYDTGYDSDGTGNDSDGSGYDSDGTGNDSDGTGNDSDGSRYDSDGSGYDSDGTGNDSAQRRGRIGSGAQRRGRIDSRYLSGLRGITPIGTPKNSYGRLINMQGVAPQEGFDSYGHLQSIAQSNATMPWNPNQLTG